MRHERGNTVVRQQQQSLAWQGTHRTEVVGPGWGQMGLRSCSTAKYELQRAPTMERCSFAWKYNLPGMFQGFKGSSCDWVYLLLQGTCSAAAFALFFCVLLVQQVNTAQDSAWDDQFESVYSAEALRSIPWLMVSTVKRVNRPFSVMYPPPPPCLKAF